MIGTRQIPYWLFGATALAALGTVIGPLTLFGISEQGWQLAARYTVRVSFPLFLLTYLARPLTTFWRSNATRWMLRNRRYLGLSFALAHTIHLGALSSYFVFIEQSPDVATLVGGGLAYALMFLMAATSNDQSVRAMGANWGRLHTIGLHYLWLIFLVTYLGRLSGGEGGNQTDALFMVGIVGSGLTFSALALRLAAAWKSRSRRATT